MRQIVLLFVILTVFVSGSFAISDETRKKIGTANKGEKAEYDKQYYKKHKEQKKQHRQRNKQQYIEKHKKYYQENKEQKKKYQKENKKKIRKYQKEYQQENKQKLKKQKKEYQQKNKKQTKKYMKKYNQEHKKQLAKYMKEYNQNYKEQRKEHWQRRYQKDTNFKLITNLRNRTKNALKYYTKTGKILKSKDHRINYQAIIKHLNKQPKTSRIHHIIPLCCFDLNKEEQIKKAFAPENHRYEEIEEHKQTHRELIEAGVQ